MPYKFNPFTSNFDYYELDTGAGDLRYLMLDTSNGPLTGQLDIIPASGDTALTVAKDIIIKAGQKLIFDGE